MFLQTASDLSKRVSSQKRKNRYVSQEINLIIQRTSLHFPDCLIKGFFGQYHKMSIFQTPDSSHSRFLLQEGKFTETLTIRQSCNCEEAWLSLLWGFLFSWRLSWVIIRLIIFRTNGFDIYWLVANINIRLREKVFHALYLAALLRNQVKFLNFAMINSHTSFICHV